ncbi:polysaccharide deacetylase family protein [Fictibacillus sp. KIGAM418]|uniref:Polysaccharide deacetylase family protein n=1 Tax=Fictibacillus marinisediminis TaxID=2878389 RepID=A0A9X1XBJ2_9BACL|nr:polysaccharide deacetylase family protein [Fictibacillus marinisediminis]MCK6257822.1 polysaccharide deacetylase family protein [Fictibacillus marinisediminis]
MSKIERTKKETQILEEDYFMGNTSKKQITLTFDDEPVNRYTPQDLKILREKGVKATLFVVGESKEISPELRPLRPNSGLCWFTYIPGTAFIRKEIGSFLFSHYIFAC